MCQKAARHKYIIFLNQYKNIIIYRCNDMSATTILTAFNDHFIEFVNDIVNVFPENADVLTAKNSLILMRKANPKLLIQIWNKNIVSKYSTIIEAGDLTFFMEKDYQDDFSRAGNAGTIMEAIDRVRAPVKTMTQEDQTKTMKYVQNLSKLSLLYQSLSS